MASSGGLRSLQAFGGTRTSTREPARSGKKKNNREGVGFRYWWASGNIRTIPGTHPFGAAVQLPACGSALGASRRTRV
jgi:hypothetical protein